MKKDYDTLTKEIPEFSKYDFDLFKKIREVIASRVFDINIKGKINKAFVPYADLLNHRNNPQTYWNFDDKIDSFIIKGVADIKKGEEIFDSYGRKPNHLLLLNYGFTIINNSANEIIVDLVLNKNYPYFEEKISYKKISFKNPITTELKLEILHNLCSIDKTAKFIGNYNDSIKGNLYTDKVIGNISYCFGLIKEKNTEY